MAGTIFAACYRQITRMIWQLPTVAFLVVLQTNFLEMRSLVITNCERGFKYRFSQSQCRF